MVPTGSVARPALTAVPLDRTERPVAYERRRVLDPDLFQAFGPRVQQALAGLIPDPLIMSWWSQAIAAQRATGNLGLTVRPAS